MKSVMISIRPKWCKLIAIGKKTVEVRKTKPKIKTPLLKRPPQSWYYVEEVER